MMTTTTTIIQFYIYLHANLRPQWSVTEEAQVKKHKQKTKTRQIII
jgi:hypothetical protein